MKTKTWNSWRDTKLAEGGVKDRSEYTVENCLQHLLKEGQLNEGDKKWLIDLIEYRFEERFIRPLCGLQKPPKGEDYVALGFTIMAVASLMIETLACFWMGQWDTDTSSRRGKEKEPKEEKDQSKLNGRMIFRRFLGDSANCFNAAGNSYFTQDEGEEFYTHIRCGILHQAEIKGTWRILHAKARPAVSRTGSGSIINAREFLKLLRAELDRYLRALERADQNNDRLWKDCRYKLLGICHSSGWDKKWNGNVEVEWTAYW